MSPKPIHEIGKCSNLFRVAVAAMSILAAGCGSPSGPDDAGDGLPGTIVQSQPGFLYLLQPETVSTEEIAAQPFTWVVLEPGRTGGADGEFTSTEIETIRTDGPCGDKIILAYLSIGEAEDYRDYWDPAWVDDQGMPREDVAPAWLGPPNPNFDGNYKVRYWDPGWQVVIYGTAGGDDRTPLDRIIDAGFDGVYLDIIDAYEFWSSTEGGNELTRALARGRMITWVTRVSDYAKVTRGVSTFLVFPQNAADIIRTDDGELDDLSEAYFAAIDGIGIEDLFYDETTPQPLEDVQYRLDQLVEYRDRGRTILVTDYVLSESFTPASSNSRVLDFYERALAQGFIPYAAVEDRDLDEVVILPAELWSVSQPPVACLTPND